MVTEGMVLALHMANQSFNPWHFQACPRCGPKCRTKSQKQSKPLFFVFWLWGHVLWCLGDHVIVGVELSLPHVKHELSPLSSLRPHTIKTPNHFFPSQRAPGNINDHEFQRIVIFFPQRNTYK